MSIRAAVRNLLFSKWYEHLPIVYAWYERSLLQDIARGPIPRHVAIIQDGNRRYARRLGESVERGHTYGADTTERVIGWCEELGVQQLTLYSFSTENFRRTETEKKAIFDIMKAKLKESRERPRTHSSQLRITCVGDISLLPPDVRQEIQETDDATASYDKYYLNLAVAYGGRKEIVDGAIKMAEQVRAGELQPEDVTEETVDRYLYFGGNPQSKVDLIIRTGGDERTSNFLPWQASGNECAIYICAPYWPEFRKVDFLRAIRTYQLREQEHRVKRAVRLIRLRREGAAAEDPAGLLRSSLGLSQAEADALLREPVVARALQRP